MGVAASRRLTGSCLEGRAARRLGAGPGNVAALSVGQVAASENGTSRRHGPSRDAALLLHNVHSHEERKRKVSGRCESVERRRLASGLSALRERWGERGDGKDLTSKC